MTTLAYRDGILAGDTMCTRGDEKGFGTQKVFKTRHFLMGICGGFSNARPMYDWLGRHEEFYHEDPERLYEEWGTIPDFSDGFSMILVGRDGRIWSAGDKNPPITVSSAYEAGGSGSDYAMGAMAMGASATEAVRIAAKFDVYTGGPVVHVKF